MDFDKFEQELMDAFKPIFERHEEQRGSGELAVAIVVRALVKYHNEVNS